MRRILLRWAMVAVPAIGSTAPAAHADESIYVRHDGASHLPLYSDRPSPAARPIAMYDDRLQRRVFTAVPPLVTVAVRHVRHISQSGEASLSVRRAATEPLVRRAALRHSVDAALITAIIDVESGFRASARSSKGARGLMQVMPATAARYGYFDLLSPGDNIDAGTHYLRDLLTRFRGDVRLAVAAYNAGEQAVARYGNRVPPFAETRDYVPRVLERYRQYRKSPANAAE
jgi:soluble lytic murein transglycosylase-like protein